MIKLSELHAVLQAMTPGTWSECCHDQPESHPCRLAWAGGELPVFTGSISGEDRGPKSDVRGIVAIHNAAPDLIAIAVAALAVEHLDDQCSDLAGPPSSLRDLQRKRAAARAVLSAALTKVSP